MRTLFTLFSAIMLAGCSCNKPAPTQSWQGEGDACNSCHQGIEPVHAYFDKGQCVVCHGGDAEALDKSQAHVAVPDNYWQVRGDLVPAAEGFIRDFKPDQLDQLDLDYVQFINPGDIRVMAATCGSCHPDEVAGLSNSVMTTNVGHYVLTRDLAGLQGPTSEYGSYAASDPDCDGSEGTVCAVDPLRPPTDAEFEAAASSGDLDEIERIAYDHYLSKGKCSDCHAAGFGPNNGAHRYRSAGCTSCHMIYGADGVYEGGDPSIPKGVPVHPSKHVLTKKIPTEQCATCHFQGGRIGLLFRGIREGGFSDTPENAAFWQESAYGHEAGYYLLDEDTTNTVDESPPDLHYALGMHCADCHVGTDVHGSGALYNTAKYQFDIACEDCHGTVRQARKPDASGRYFTQSGRLLPQLSTGEGGQVVLTGIVDGAEHVVAQAADLLAERGPSSKMHEAMAPNSDDWSHTDSLTCDTCHTSYNQFCLGCHVSVDMRLKQTDQQTGVQSRGLVRGSREYYSIHNVLLGQRADGRIQSIIPTAQVQMSVIDAQGELLLGAWVDEPGGKTSGVFRRDEAGAVRNGFTPFFQHTTTDTPRTCATCHRTADTPEEWTRVKGVYGFGTGEFMLENPEGDDVDALQFLNADGTPVAAWQHVGTGPVPETMRDRALAVEVSP